LAPTTLRFEEAQRHQRVGDPALAQQKGDQQGERDQQAADRARVDPAPFGDLQDREDAEHQGEGHEGGAGEVGAFLQPDALGVVDQAQRQPADQHPDRQVDDEDEVPGDRLGEDAAEQQADRAARRGDEAVDADRFRLLGAVGEHPHDHRQDHRRGERPADSLDEAGADQHALVGRGGAESRGDREDGEADDEDAALAEQVTEPARQEQEAAEGNQVGVDHPGQVGLREVQVVLDRGQGDVHDRRVEDDHQHPRAEDVEGEPAVFLGGGVHGGQTGRGSRTHRCRVGHICTAQASPS
jgi:hypothetical protein